MKKTLLAMAIVATTISASAVSISWSGNTSNSKLFGLTDGSTLSVGTGSETAGLKAYYILYSNYETVKALGKVEASEIETYAVATASGQTSGSAGAAGRMGTSSTTTDFTDAGVSFFARVYTSFEGKSYFMDVFGGSGDGGVWTTTSSGDETVVEKLAWANSTSYGGSTSTSVGTKNAWVAVPEPSTAALALAGLARLLKRRKA